VFNKPYAIIVNQSTPSQPWHLKTRDRSTFGACFLFCTYSIVDEENGNMDASLIRKIQKSKEYALEPERVTFHTLEIQFHGDNNDYVIILGNDGWSCTCPGFKSYGICPHIMAVEKIFKPMLKRDPLPYSDGQNIVSDVKKSKRYSEETDRIKIVAFAAAFKGDNKDHLITYRQGVWDNPSSSYFAQHGISTHIMTMERLLKGWVQPLQMVRPEEAVE
jgi:hypothetical protein